MANWWDAAPVVENRADPNWWDSAPAVEAAEPQKGVLLPFSRDEQGNVSFDSDAGLLGVAKRAFMLPGQVMKGEVDPTSPEGIERAAEFASMVTPINPAVRAGEWAIPGVRNSLKKPDLKAPTALELREASDGLYEQAKEMGAEYSSQAVADVAKRVQSKLEEDGVISELAPKAFATLGKLQSPPEDSIATISGLDAARRVFGHIGRDFTNPTEQLASGRAQRAIDDFLGGPPDGSFLPENLEAVQGASRAINDARGNYAAHKRSLSLAGIEDAADLRAAAANSGQNSGNALRQRIASLILNPKASSGFTGDEKAALEGVVKGSRGANATRYLGNLLGGGGGLGAALTGGLAGTAAAIGTGNPAMSAIGVATPIFGAATKKVSNRLTEKALHAVDEATRKRSPLYEKMVQGAAREANLPAKKLAAIRALIMGASNGGGGW